MNDNLKKDTPGMLSAQQMLLMREKDASGLLIIPDNPDKCDAIVRFIGIVTPIQTHSLNVAVVKKRFEKNIPDTDALVTFTDDIALGIRTADCVPVIVYAPDVTGIAAIHAGWKGSLGGIVENTLDVLAERGADPAKMKVTFGPSISKERYEVDSELAERFIEAGFKEQVSYPGGTDGKPHIDLQGVNAQRFIRRGVKPENITLFQGCTYSSTDDEGNPLFPSYRRDGDQAGRMLTTVCIVK